MAQPWSAVEANPQYQALPPDQKEAARNQYFQQVVAPKVPDAERATARSQFDAATGPRKAPVSAPSAHPGANTAGFIGGNLGKGVASVAGMPVDLASDAVEGVKGVANLFGAHLKADEKPVGGSAWFEDEFKRHGMMPSDAVTTPTSTGGRIAAAALQALPQGALPGGGAKAAARYLGAAASGAGGEIGRVVGGTPGQLVGSMLGGAGGGMAGRENPRIAAGADAKRVPTAAQLAADRAGIPLTQGQSTGSQPLRWIEDQLHNTFGSRGTAQESGVDQAAKAVDSINRLADQMQEAPKGVEQADARTNIGERVQNAYKTAIDSMVKARKADADKNYSAVRALAGDQPVVKYDNTMRELDAIIAEHEGVPSDDARTITRKARQMKEDLTTQTPGAAATPATPPSSILDAQGRPLRAGTPATPAGPTQTGVAAHTITNAVRTASNWGAAARRTGNIFQDIDPNANQILAKRLYGAIKRDFDAAAATPDAAWAPALAAANTRYARQSRTIDYVTQSTLGKMLGKDLFDADYSGLQASTKSPESVARKLLALDPSEARHAASILQKHAPETLQGVKAFMFRDALARSMDETAPGTTQLNFTKFRANVKKMEPQLNHLGFTSDEKSQINDIIGTMETIGKQAKPKAGFTGADKAEGAALLTATVMGQGLHAAAIAGITAIGARGFSSLLMTQSGRQVLRQIMRAKDVRSQMAALGAARGLATAYGAYDEQKRAGQSAPAVQTGQQAAPAQNRPTLTARPNAAQTARPQAGSPANAAQAPTTNPADQVTVRQLAGLGVQGSQASLLMRMASERNGMARIKAMKPPRAVLEALYKWKAQAGQ
ncbi:hypothetical protein [Paraburkholderia sp. RL17-373-BIF-A]|uniref:hypothetical protein n=1 Tax=Paraburkholderia sp. RL17-373-BIF-A TaxID=3031629 RepID=UPI0038BD93FD